MAVPVITFAQSDSTIKMQADTIDRIRRLEMASIYMRDNLIRAHNQYSNGLGILGLGAAIATIGVVINPEITVHTDGSETKDYTLKNIITGVGCIGMLVGSIMMIDSHKYIGKAGRWTYTGNGIVYKLSP